MSRPAAPRGEKAERAEPVVDGHDDDVAAHRERGSRRRSPACSSRSTKPPPWNQTMTGRRPSSTPACRRSATDNPRPSARAPCRAAGSPAADRRAPAPSAGRDAGPRRGRLRRREAQPADRRRRRTGCRERSDGSGSRVPRRALAWFRRLPWDAYRRLDGRRSTPSRDRRAAPGSSPGRPRPSSCRPRASGPR